MSKPTEPSKQSDAYRDRVRIAVAAWQAGLRR